MLKLWSRSPRELRQSYNSIVTVVNYSYGRDKTIIHYSAMYAYNGITAYLVPPTFKLTISW